MSDDKNEREHGDILSPDRRAELASVESERERLFRMAGDMCTARKRANADTHQAFYDTLLSERAQSRAEGDQEGYERGRADESKDRLDVARMLGSTMAENVKLERDLTAEREKYKKAGRYGASSIHGDSAALPTSSRAMTRRPPARRVRKRRPPCATRRIATSFAHKVRRTDKHIRRPRIERRATGEQPTLTRRAQSQ